MKRVLLLLAKGVEAYEAAAFTDVIAWANAYGDDPIGITSAGLHPQIPCVSGFHVVPDVQLKDLDINAYDALAIPGGFEPPGFYEDAYSEEFLDIIREFHRTDKPIASICVGALPLAKSGILKGKRATTYKMLDGKRQKQLAEMDVSVADASIVCENNVITSTSPATAVEVSLMLLERLTSKENAQNIRKLMGFGKNDSE